MRFVSTDHIGDLAAIFEDDVELISVVRPCVPTLRSLVRRVLDARHDLQLRWVQLADDRAGVADALQSLDVLGDTRLLTGEIDLAVEALSALLGCHAVGIRVTTLHRPMCPRFHVDRVPCRLLITLDGPGTEWIPHDRVDQLALNDRSTDAEPLRTGCHVERLAPGAWSLMKGGTWDERFPGVVHRSPHDPGNRLLVSLDPLTSAQAHAKADA